MADVQKTIDIVFGAQDSNLSRTINGIQSSLNEFSGDVHNVTAPLASFASDLLQTEAAIGAMGAAMVGFAVNEAGSFNSSIKESGALFNANSEQLDLLSDNILAFARDSVFSFEDIHKAQFKALSTGTDYTEVTARLGEAQKLAIASSSGLESSTALLSQSMNIYGSSAGTAKEVSEALFVAAQQGDTNFQLLSGSLGQLLQPAKAANVEFEEMLAAVAAVTIGTGQTAETMTLLKALFKELASPSDELSKALGGMSLETNSLQEIMQQLQKVTGGQFAAMDKLFGSTEAVNGALILANDTSGKFASSLVAMNEKTGTVDAAYTSMADGFNNVNQKLVNNIKATLVDVGIPLLDEYGSAVGALTSVFDAVGQGVKTGGLKVIEDALEDFLASGTTTLNDIANAFPDALDKMDFSDLLQSFNNLRDAFKDIFESIFGENLDLSNADDLAKVLQQIVDFLTLLTNASAGTIKALDPLIDSVVSFLQTLANSDANTQTFLGNIGGISISIEKLLPLLKFMADGLSLVGGALAVVGGASLATKTLGGIASTLTSVSPTNVALAAAIGSVTFAVNENVKAYDDYTRNQQLFDDAQKGIADHNIKLAASFKEITAATGITINSIDDLINAEERGLIVRDESTGAWKKAGEAIRDYDAEVESAVDESWKFADAFDVVNDVLRSIGQGADAAADKTKGLTRVMFEGREVTESYRDAMLEARNAGGGLIRTLADGTSQFTPYQQATKDAAVATDNLSESQKIAIQNAQELQLTLLQLASDERIKYMEFAANINVAQIEADAQTTVAAFESIASSVDSTNDLISELFSHEAPNWDKFGFETKEAIERAQDRAEKLTDSQIELNDAQIRILNARADALERGDAMIQINADSLEPELQLVLKSLMENVQIEANANGLELLT